MKVNGVKGVNGAAADSDSEDESSEEESEEETKAPPKKTKKPGMCEKRIGCGFVSDYVCLGGGGGWVKYW